jgi:diacylglycerol kinase (ATP)
MRCDLAHLLGEVAMSSNDIPIAKSGESFNLADRARSFRYAAKGIAFMLRTQHNAWVHLAATLAVALAGAWFELSAADWRWLTAAVILVWLAEAMNTAFEHLCDVVSPEFHPSVEKAKDIAAGAVLLCACGAFVLGALTFWPYLVVAPK